MQSSSMCSGRYYIVGRSGTLPTSEPAKNMGYEFIVCLVLKKVDSFKCMSCCHLDMIFFISGDSM